MLGLDVFDEQNSFGKLSRLEEVIYYFSDQELTVSKLPDYPSMAYYLLNDKNMDAINKARALLGMEG